MIDLILTLRIILRLRCGDPGPRWAISMPDPIFEILYDSTGANGDSSFYRLEYRREEKGRERQREREKELRCGTDVIGPA